MLRLFKDNRKSISWSAKKKQLTGNFILDHEGSFLAEPEHHTKKGKDEEK